MQKVEYRHRKLLKKLGFKVENQPKYILNMIETFESVLEDYNDADPEIKEILKARLLRMDLEIEEELLDEYEEILEEDSYENQLDKYSTSDIRSKAFKIIHSLFPGLEKVHGTGKDLKFSPKSGGKLWLDTKNKSDQVTFWYFSGIEQDVQFNVSLDYSKKEAITTSRAFSADYEIQYGMEGLNFNEASAFAMEITLNLSLIKWLEDIKKEGFQKEKSAVQKKVKVLSGKYDLFQQQQDILKSYLNQEVTRMELVKKGFKGMLEGKVVTVGDYTLIRTSLFSFRYRIVPAMKQTG